MRTDEEFIKAHKSKITDFKPLAGTKTKGLFVGKYFAITQNDGYIIYNAKLRVPLIRTKFHSVIDAHRFCERLTKIYGELLYILIDEDYAEHFFTITRYTIPNGMKLYEGIRSFEKLDLIRRADLVSILDN